MAFNGTGDFVRGACGAVGANTYAGFPDPPYAGSARHGSAEQAARGYPQGGTYFDYEGLRTPTPRGTRRAKTDAKSGLNDVPHVVSTLSPWVWVFA